MADYNGKHVGADIDEAIDMLKSGRLVTQDELSEAIATAITTTLNTKV